MIRIIDATLSMLDDYNLNEEKIYGFIELMGKIGIKNLQISINTYYTLEGNLPDGFQYYLEIDPASYMNGIFPSEDENIKYFFVPKQQHRDKEIATYHINDLEDPLKGEARSKEGLIKVIGLDNLILGGANAGIEALKAQYNLNQLILCPEDTYHCATAIAVLFIQNKGYGVVSSMLGIGNKAATEQIILALHVLERYMINKTFCEMKEIKNWIEENFQISIAPMTPVLGDKIFYVESGVHVDGILKKPTNYEPYAPELVGLERKIILGKHAGKNSVSYKLNELNLTGINQNDLKNILEEVKHQSRLNGMDITDQEFIKIVERYGKNEKST
ncbi:MAG: hypothetical protein PHY47_19970 [Lachnospiraceae bacterium]|nr:hypothetical protein [Lachnospiraceae bacterium]